MGIEQSGTITPGHMAIWGSPGIIRDGGSPVVAQRVIACLLDADFDDVNDQPIILPPALTAFQLTGILITNASVSLATAAGGFYPAASKAGSPIVAAGQVYSSLTTGDLLLSAMLTAFAQTARFSRTNLADWAIYLSLTTGQPFPATADVYLIGIDLSA